MTPSRPLWLLLVTSVVLTGAQSGAQIIGNNLDHVIVKSSENTCSSKDTFVSYFQPGFSSAPCGQKNLSTPRLVPGASSDVESSPLDEEAPSSPQLRALLESLPVLSPTVDADGLCGQHSRAVRRAAANLELWALKMYDSSAKVPSGLLNGNVNQFGDFNQCLGVRHEVPGLGEVRGQYCLAFLDVRLRGQEPPNKRLAHLLRLAHSYDVIKSNFSDPGHRIPRYSTLNWAVCAPASCSAHDVELGLRRTLAPLAAVPELEVRVKVDPQVCYVKQAVDLDTGTLMTIGLFSTIVGLAIVATIIDKSLDSPSEKPHEIKSRWQRCLLAFSLRRTTRQLLSTSVVKDDLSSVHGVRFLNAFGLIICHKSMALFFQPFVNRTDMTERVSMPWTVIGRTAIIYTDAFILISGLLVAYSLVPELDRNKGRINVRSKIVARFLRIMPNLVAIILFCTYLLQMMGSGPQWNLVVKHYSDICKGHMWKNFLFIHNFFGFEKMCLTHTHQVGMDMQLFLFSPLAVWLLWRWPRAGLTALFGVATYSTWLRYVVTFDNQLSSVVYFGISVSRMFNTAKSTYIVPHHRATIYLMGIVLGYYLRRYPNGFNLSTGWTAACWTLTGVAAIFPWFSPYNSASMHFQYDAAEAARYTAYSPIGWGLFSVGLIVLCLQQRGGWIGKFLRWKGFVVYTRISYAVYLTQFPIFFYNVGSRKHASYSTLFDLFDIEEISVVIMASVILTLLVDLPFQEIKKVLTGKKSVVKAVGSENSAGPHGSGGESSGATAAVTPAKSLGRGATVASG